mgnify:CR=1 FL=1
MAFDTGGAASGALSGAAAGTAVMPGIGTAVGAIGGGLLGGLLGGAEEAEMSEEEKQIRRMQLANLQRLEQRAAGRGIPSAAEQMVQHNRAENAGRQMSFAKSLGGDPALANRLASEGVARGNAEASYQGAQIRAQEQQAAQAAYNQALGQARGPDASFSATQTGVNLAEKERQRKMYGDMLNNAGQVVGGFF